MNNLGNVWSDKNERIFCLMKKKSSLNRDADGIIGRSLCFEHPLNTVNKFQGLDDTLG